MQEINNIKEELIIFEKINETLELATINVIINNVTVKEDYSIEELKELQNYLTTIAKNSLLMESYVDSVLQSISADQESEENSTYSFKLNQEEMKNVIKNPFIYKK